MEIYVDVILWWDHSSSCLQVTWIVSQEWFPQYAHSIQAVPSRLFSIFVVQGIFKHLHPHSTRSGGMRGVMPHTQRGIFPFTSIGYQQLAGANLNQLKISSSQDFRKSHFHYTQICGSKVMYSLISLALG